MKNIEVYVDKDLRGGEAVVASAGATAMPLSTLSKNVLPSKTGTAEALKEGAGSHSLGACAGRLQTNEKAHRGFHNRSYAQVETEKQLHFSSIGVMHGVARDGEVASRGIEACRRNLKIDTQRVKDVIAATENYLRNSVESSSPASTISNVTPVSDVIKLSSENGRSKGDTQEMHKLVGDCPQPGEDIKRQTTLLSEPRIISRPQYDYGAHYRKGSLAPPSVVARSSAANEQDFGTRGLASPLGRMILRSPSPSIVYYDQTGNSTGNAIRRPHSETSGYSKKGGLENKVVDTGRDKAASMSSWPNKLHQFKRNVIDSNTHRRPSSLSTSSTVESFSSSSDDLSIDMESSSFEESGSVILSSKPDFQRSRSVDITKRRTLNNLRNSADNVYKVQNREKSLSADVCFDGEIRSISIRRKLSKICDEDGDDILEVADDIANETIRCNGKFKSISSRKRQQDGSPCEFEAPPKIVAKSNLSLTSGVIAHDFSSDHACKKRALDAKEDPKEEFAIPSPRQPKQELQGLPPLRRTLSPNIMNSKRREKAPFSNPVDDYNLDVDNCVASIHEKFLCIKKMPAFSPSKSVGFDRVERDETQAASNPNNVDICGLSSMDEPSSVPATSTTKENESDASMVFAEPTFLLPSIDSSNGCGLKTVSCETVNRLLNGEFDDTVKKYIIVDCRFEYEYNGGHIVNAINIVRPEHAVEKFFKAHIYDSNTCILFHCEFSSHRAPKMMEEVRRIDRKLHEESYPELYYPQLYLIKGGYKEFFESYRGKCEPQAYVEMLHGDFTDVCRSTASMVRRSWRRHKSFDTNVLRHSSPALLPSGSSTNIGGGCDGPKRRSRKKNGRASRSIRALSRSYRGNLRSNVSLFPEDEEGVAIDHHDVQPRNSILNRETSYSEGCDNIVVRFDGRCDDRNQAEERESNSL